MTVVHPGGVKTDIAKSARPPRHVTSEEANLIAAERERFHKFLRMSPTEAGEVIVAGIEKNKARVLVGRDAKIAALLERLAPIGYWNILKRGTA